MTTQEVKSYLNRAREAERVCRLAHDKAERYRELLQGGKTIKYGSTGETKERNENPIEAAYVLLADYETEYRTALNKLVEIRKEIGAYIDTLPHPEKEVLTRRYICYQRWEDIAEAMNYNQRHVFKLHGAALQRMALNGTIIL